MAAGICGEALDVETFGDNFKMLGSLDHVADVRFCEVCEFDAGGTHA